MHLHELMLSSQSDMHFLTEPHTVCIYKLSKSGTACTCILEKRFIKHSTLLLPSLCVQCYEVLQADDQCDQHQRCASR